jgi:hypothetical protein
MNITITKHENIRSSTIGAFLYWHRVQYELDGYGYDCTMSDEGMMYMIDALKKAGNKVTFITK